MLFKVTIATAITLLSSLAFAGPVSNTINDLQNVNRSSATKTLLTRAPSDYPLDPGPFPNEFKYENWDPTDDVQRKQLQKIHEAFGEWRQMAMQALAKIKEPDASMIDRWYGNEEPVDDLQGVFENMWNDESGQAADKVSTMVCDYLDFKNFCNENRNAYTDPDSGRFHICAKGYILKLNSEIDCDSLDASCSLKMRSLPMTLLHEMTHYDTIGEEGRGIRIVDVDNGRGAYDCFTLGSDDKSDNAQNYAWLAGEAYWSSQCDKTFQDPAPGVQ